MLLEDTDKWIGRVEMKMLSVDVHVNTTTYMLGAICGYARSMDRAAQSMDPKFAQESMDRAEICGSHRVDRSCLRDLQVLYTFMNSYC